jgi:hypothetical protein
LAEVTLKDKLWDTLNEFKTRTLNEEELERATLQCDEMLQHLKVTNGHATRNVLKRCQSLIDGALMSTTSTPPLISLKIV